MSESAELMAWQQAIDCSNLLAIANRMLLTQL